jgi:hypothetical protein
MPGTSPTNAPREARLALAKELVRDLEGGLVPLRSLLMKGSRLADLVADAEVKRWLGFELGGYDATGLSPTEMLALIKAMERTARTPAVPPGALVNDAAVVLEKLIRLCV